MMIVISEGIAVICLKQNEEFENWINVILLSSY